MIHVILTDIEGTTSSIEFVHQVLFPYSARVMPEFLTENAANPAVRPWLAHITAETGASSLEAINHQLQGWISADVKHPALKALQGMIWKKGYQTAQYQAHAYPDVAPALQAWQQQGKLIYVYSSGSVAAQKLFFKFSDAGDLSARFSGYFDTSSGPKREARSYTHIARCIGRLPGEILFLSDIEAELDAAAEASMATTQLLRPGTIASLRHRKVREFTEI
jgi:enolase-phosphatase E1